MSACSTRACAMNIDSIIMTEHVVAHAVDRHTVLMIFTALCGNCLCRQDQSFKSGVQSFWWLEGGPVNKESVLIREQKCVSVLIEMERDVMRIY